MKSKFDHKDPTPLYIQIENDIKGRIDSNDLRPGDQIGSQSELSSEYNVSAITVKKAISNLISEGILYSRIGKGTFVAQIKEEPKLVRNKTIGLVLHDLKHPFFSLILSAIEEEVYNLGYNLLLSSSTKKIEREEVHINHFLEIGVDALIIASLSLEYKATPIIQKLHDENFPYIMVSYMHDPQYWFVGSDHEFGGFLATEHLINSGYRNVGYVHVGQDNLLSQVRKNGYTRALNEYKIDYNSNLIYSMGKEDYDSGADRRELGYNFAKKFLKMKERADALFFYNDNSAFGFMQKIQEEGISIPEEIAIVGYDDVEFTRYSSIPLSTIRQPVEKIGSSAVQIIDKRINRRDVMNRMIFKPELIVRQSTVQNVELKGRVKKKLA
ncbi:MAG: GntR family transcriptional regulator [Melioribacteraceae bacterium]|nr:GntR family transcriptional regulator [Melioribacteraceae bacterium]MCF8265704.1 GntR family transcriptional regulator [Melioribacteraceae bacterium]MCF8413545.1 GntR family transcriptional regulator [Melioribacteraceae bacterium]MCF8431379.1 GntR family transcriptional regulator [Melioribacteraceae bacterium]